MNHPEPLKQPVFSIVIPVWNEQEVIPGLYQRLVQTMESTGESWEVICVNDGSKDRSLELLVEVSRGDSRVKVLNFSRNFGHQVAITAGFDYAEGDAVIVMDADLQDPPALLAEMYRKYKEGFEVVDARRRARHGESWYKKITPRTF